MYIERRYLVMIVRWMGNHASTCGVIGKGVTRDDDPVHDLLGRTGNLLGNLLGEGCSIAEASVRGGVARGCISTYTYAHSAP